MQPRHQVSRAAIDLIKTFEGYRRKAARLADGRWTIGYGHTLTAREGAEVSERDAEALLTYDLIAVAHAVNDWTYTPLTQNQFDALCAFAFNIGVQNFRGSLVLRRINEGQLLQAVFAMELWRKADFEGARIVIDALVRRRAAEKTLFLTPAQGWIPVPSSILPPNVDADVAGEGPLETPTVVTASMEGDHAVAEREPVAEEPPTATQRAVAAVTSHLQTIFPDEDPAADVEIQPQPEPEPEPQPEPEPEPEAVIAQMTPATDPAFEPAYELPEPEAPSPPPPMSAFSIARGRPLAANAEAAFELTSPELNFDLELRPDPPRIETPVAANEGGPTLFDPLASLGPDPLAQPSPPIQERLDRILIDDTEEAADADFDRLAPEAPKFGLLPAIGVILVGIAFFAGGLFWTATAHAGQGLFNPWMVGFLAGLGGVGFITIGVYMLLGRLAHIDPESADGGA